MRVDELFEDPDGEKMFSGQYFYQPEETVMGHYIPLSKKSKEGVDSSKKKVQVPQIAGRLFLAADEDNKTYNLVHSLDSVNRKVIVHRVKPGNRVPPLKDNSEYWFDQCHSTKHFVFRDYYERGEEPDFVKLPSHTTLRVLELCSGAGGTSFLCQAAKMNGKTIHLKSCWAIDIAEDANATFEINEPECFVYNIGIDEALMLSMIWETDVLSKYGPKTKASSGKSSDVIVEIIDVKLCDSAVRGTSGQSKGHLLNNLERDQCWIEYLCVMREKGTIFATDRLEDEVRWIMDSEMPPCEKEMRDFVALERAQCRIPVRGDVDIIMGGPPCQGLSGLNRNAARIDILKDPKNRLVMVYYDIVRWFEPRFTVMEQVLDAFKKENALYARFMASAITALRYQCRIGIIAAGDHGCPQGRYRVITWSAKQGMPLPQFPEPSHRCLDFKTPVPEVAKKCLVVFKSKMSLKASYPMTVNGDILEDLPPVGNFSFSDGLSYASACTRPWQIFVRRKPPSGSPSAVARAKAASQLMSALDIKRLLYLMALHDQKPARLGFEFFCGRRPIPNEQLKTDDVGEEQDKIEVGESDDREDEEEGEEGEEEAECVNPAKENEEDELATIGESELKVESNFARQTWRALLKTIKDHDMRVIVNNQRESTANAYAEQMGEMIYGEVVKAIESIERTQGLKEGEEELRDHRPLNNNLGECIVPSLLFD
jgi:site-specific DNA-cytosine methylase